MVCVFRCPSHKSATRTALIAFGFALVLTFGLGATNAGAASFTVVSGNLDAGYACPSPPTVSCFGERDFDLDGSFPIAGTVDIDLGLGLIDIEITVATAVMTGSFGGVEQIDFTTMTYKVEDMPIIGTVPTPFGSGQVFGGTKLGDVDGNYEQFDGVPNSVAGPDVVNVTADFNSFSCLFSGGTGVCGFSVGDEGGFTLDVGDSSTADHDFRHTFNFSIIPEPGTLGLLAAGLAGLAFYQRRSH